ncbi:hypothetical protein E2542_SST00894 [Spatholobus suberectus]|nr:hypothetical protein E2542_SST00894 [Spatholobus suberectus]
MSAATVATAASYNPIAQNPQSHFQLLYNSIGPAKSFSQAALPPSCAITIESISASHCLVQSKSLSISSIPTRVCRLCHCRFDHAFIATIASANTGPFSLSSAAAKVNKKGNLVSLDLPGAPASCYCLSFLSIKRWLSSLFRLCVG